MCTVHRESQIRSLCKDEGDVNSLLLTYIN